MNKRIFRKMLCVQGTKLLVQGKQYSVELVKIKKANSSPIQYVDRIKVLHPCGLTILVSPKRFK